MYAGPGGETVEIYMSLSSGELWINCEPLQEFPILFFLVFSSECLALEYDADETTKLFGKLELRECEKKGI